MARYILRYTGSGAGPAADAASIEARDGVRVLDKSGRMVLVEAADDVARKLAGEMPGWVVEPEITYPVPDTRRKPLRPPGGG